MQQTRGYRDLVAWRKGVEMVKETYRLISRLPKAEMFELSSQMRKAAVSVPANIAEGQARRTAGEFLYHLGVARGSLAELDTLLEVGVEVGYFPSELALPIAERFIELRKILQGLIDAIDRQSSTSTSRPARTLSKPA